jgi:hypothetical protein
MTIDTLKVARRLREAGFTEPQAEAVVEAVRDGADDAHLATKQDLVLLSTELRAEIAQLGTELRGEMREMEQRLIARIVSANAASQNRVMGMILGGVSVNVVTILGAMFAAVKLLAH